MATAVERLTVVVVAFGVLVVMAVEDILKTMATSDVMFYRGRGTGVCDSCRGHAGT